jgi:hypothetical protein
MATITSAQTGNFSDTATWVGGVVPTVGDIAVAATGHVIAIDTDVTLTRVTQLGNGKFTLGGGRTLTANVEAVSGSFTSGGTVEVTATSGSTAYIVGNVTGVTSTIVNICAVNITGTGTLDLIGNVIGSSGNASAAIMYTNVTCIVNITGNVNGGGGVSKRAIQIDTNSNANITIIGNVTAGNQSAFGVFSVGPEPTITIVGDVSSGSGAGAAGISITGTSTSLIITGNISSINAASIFGVHGISNTGTQSNIIITGNIIAGNFNGSHCVLLSGASNNIIVTGNITGGGAASNGIAASGTSATITVTGDITGGGGTTAYGISATGASATINVTGDVSGGGGPGTSAHGIYATGASSIIDVTGTITGTNNTSCGVRSDATTGYVLFGGNLIDSPAGATALFALRARIKTAELSGYNQYSTTDGFTTGSQVQRVSADIVTGMPADTDVRLATTYGYNDELTGTMIVPPSSSVLTGVLVDAGTGSLTFDTKEEIADAVLYLLAGITETGSVVTIPFYSGSKDYTRTTIVDGTRTKTFTEL